MTESEIQKQIIDYCSSRGALVLRMNSGSRNYNNKQAPAGTPDLLVIRLPESVWIEVKTKDGKVSDIQKKMHTELINRGQAVMVARSLDDVIEYFK